MTARAALPGVRVREMRWWDIEAAVELEHRLFPEDAWTVGMFWSELADTRHPTAGRRYVVAEDTADGTLAGYAGLWANGDEADVQTIATARERWGSGLGPELLRLLLAEAARRGCRRMLLEVRVDNLRARRLYERFGFTALGVRRNYYAEAGVDALVMEVALDPGAAPTETAHPRKDDDDG